MSLRKDAVQKLEQTLEDSNIEVNSDDDGERSSNEQSSSYESGTDTGSGSGTGRSGSTDEFASIKSGLAKQETKQVFRLRVLVVLLLVAAATSISVTVYYLTSTAEIEEFETLYYGNAEKIIDALQEVMVEMTAVSALAVAATADTQEQLRLAALENQDEEADSAWPRFTMTNFQERAGNARTQSGAIYVSINPIVAVHDLSKWERYVGSDEFNYWIEEGLEYQRKQGLGDLTNKEQDEKGWLTYSKVDPLHTFDVSGRPSLSLVDGPFLPRWQSSPVLTRSLVNENILEDPRVSQTARDCIESKAAVLSRFVTAPPGSVSHPDPTTSFFATILSIKEGEQVEYPGDPISNLMMPIFDKLDANDQQVVAILQSTISWRSHLRKILPSSNNGVNVVVDNVCDGNFTYYLEGDEAYAVGFGDLHDRSLSSYEVTGRFRSDIIDDGTIGGVHLNQKGCPYTFHVYPTQQEKDSHVSKDPLIISLSVAAVFAFTIGMFFFYDYLVERRQRLILAKATQSTAIVSSLFPKQVRDRLLAVENDKRKGDAMVAPKNRLKSFLNAGAHENDDAQPIADLFPNCTVCFSDIAGFTAWSSTREPAQVFLLLQKIYQNFDIIAKRRRVFKVETIGDSYVAVTGLPEPQSHHASIMAKFAWDCLMRLGEVLKDLEVSLGPDTGELSMRFGMHSGSVTAGVLKGDRARFQLFGDTVNTAARMESTGIRGRIQVSESTAELLRSGGKEAWLTRREDQVLAKGKGAMNTYWLTVGVGSAYLNASSVGSGEDLHANSEMLKNDPEASRRSDMKKSRLVDWVSEILMEHIKKVVIVHERCYKRTSMVNEDLRYDAPEGSMPLDEVREAITMPKFDARVADAALDSQLVNVPSDISDLLREYVSLIADSYRDNPFHNFEHACHVTMSVNKLLSRIVTPDLANTPTDMMMKKGRSEVAADIHNFSHGLTSDPMAVFAIVFSALIHDADHQGVSNVQLVKEEPGMGEMYQNKSVAEQNSLDVAWDMLMSKQFDKLRKYIFGTRAEMLRFRQLIVNVVLATDIFDKELGQLRKDRWNQAFHGDESLATDHVNNLRATIVMEHIIQASDVSHTMQHWHVYQKWNRKLFKEMYQAYKAGRMGADPSGFWYQGELGFFDNYIIPLSKKLKECGVFGVSSDEYLGYALKNRAEWEERGEEMLKGMIEEVEQLYPSAAETTAHSRASGATVETAGSPSSGSSP